jgi:hypothetical protein
MLKIIITFFVSMVIVVFTISCKSNVQSDTRSLDTAFVQKMNNQDSLIIMVYQKKQYMVHDLVSVLKTPRYYIDSILFFVPDRHQNFIKFNEVKLAGTGHYPFVKGGISFSSDSVKIDLSFDDFDDKKIYAPGWNGTYLVKWIK